MTKEEILEGNKLIAHFMGLTAPEEDYYDDENYFRKGIKRRYHTSWDWLMPVVEKIENIDNGRFSVDISTFGTEIKDYANGQDLIYAAHRYDKEVKIELLYMSVKEFIIWYNKEQTDERSVAWVTDYCEEVTTNNTL